jgi:predicted DNA-binding transcriptional regulator AlpA
MPKLPKKAERKFPGGDQMLKTAYSISEVADFFQVSTRTIRVWLEKDHSFPRPFKKFGTLRFNRSEIEQYWTENTLGEEEGGN